MVLPCIDNWDSGQVLRYQAHWPTNCIIQVHANMTIDQYVRRRFWIILIFSIMAVPFPQPPVYWLSFNISATLKEQFLSTDARNIILKDVRYCVFIKRDFDCFRVRFHRNNIEHFSPLTPTFFLNMEDNGVLRTLVNYFKNCNTLSLSLLDLKIVLVDGVDWIGIRKKHL